MRKFIERFKQAPVFSTVYVLGSALSVASIMLVAIFLHVKTADIYPETDRSELLYYGYMNLKNRDAGIEENADMGYGTVDDLKHALDSLAYVAAVEPWNPIKAYVGSTRFENIVVKRADSDIFKVYDYEFIEGGPYTTEDEWAGIRKTVITDKLALRLFGSDKDIVGKEVEFDTATQQLLGTRSRTQPRFYGRRFGSEHYGREEQYMVVGVIRQGSRLLNRSFAEAFIMPSKPWDVPRIRSKGMQIIRFDENGQMQEEYTDDGDGKVNKYLGKFGLVVRPKPGVTADRIRAVTNEWMRRINSSEDFELSMGTWPRSELQLEFGDEDDESEEFDASGVFSLYILLALVLLLVPALNLSSLISGNMDAKMSEMGVRKAFGAGRGRLLRECIDENLWLTGCGSILGLLMAWGGVMMWRDWLFVGASDTYGLSAAQVSIDPAMLFAPSVFIVAVVVCYILNLLSSIIPIWLALRKPVIDSIRVKS